jgi:hypothetical protein
MNERQCYGYFDAVSAAAISSSTLFVRGRGRTASVFLGRVGIGEVHKVLSLSLQGGARVLDFGCGTRPYEPWFAAAGAHYRGGAELDAAHEARIRSDGTLDRGDAEYDVVASFEVLEDVWNIGTYLGGARRILRRGAMLPLSTHGTWLYHRHPHDLRRWTAERLLREIESRGFNLVAMFPVIGPMVWATVLWLRGARHFLSKISWLARTIWALVAVLMNVRSWIEDRMTLKPSRQMTPASTSACSVWRVEL